ncbi:MAG: TIGR03013 family PEP-CTERM/XrtA system glycosyltransferase [Acidobacteriia bacterium]|nr:TIGR03013 family PEP-CTERM/XrtA system glycosyltransferase [Terriglobia bacterium]
MIRLLHAYFPVRTLFLGISEALLVSLAFAAATVARLGADGAGYALNQQHGSMKIFFISVAFVVCMYYFDLYDSAILGNRREALIRLTQAMGAVYGLLLLVYYVYPPLELGREIFAIGLALVSLSLFFWRGLFWKINRIPDFADRVVILGDGPLADLLEQEYQARPELGLRVVGRIAAASGADAQPVAVPGERPGEAAGKQAVEDLSRAVKFFRASSIVVAMGDRRGKLPVDALLAMKCRGLQVHDGADLYEAITGKVQTEYVRLGWLLFSPGCHASKIHLAYKRAASVFVSISGLILTLPLLPWIYLAIRLTSRGPVLYRQERVGRDGVEFHCYKFRTMRQDAEADTGPTWAADDDPRITRVGAFLRSARLDEIPQLWNVLRGDMCLVGPRPERPEFVSALRGEIPYYDLRHTVRPGITGWAQVRHKYASSAEDAREKLRYDLFYIKNMSMGLDLLVFFQTIRVILWARGAK